MTQGRLRKEDLMINSHGYISKKHNLMKTKENPLRQRGLLQNKKSKNKKGSFGPKKTKKKL